MHTSNRGGSSDTEVKLLAVKPTGLPLPSTQVTTVTPVAKQPSASRKVRGSEPVRYSRTGASSAIAKGYSAPDRFLHRSGTESRQQARARQWLECLAGALGVECLAFGQFALG